MLGVPKSVSSIQKGLSCRSLLYQGVSISKNSGHRGTIQRVRSIANHPADIHKRQPISFEVSNSTGMILADVAAFLTEITVEQQIFGPSTSELFFKI